MNKVCAPKLKLKLILILKSKLSDRAKRESQRERVSCEGDDVVILRRKIFLQVSILYYAMHCAMWYFWLKFKLKSVLSVLVAFISLAFSKKRKKNCAWNKWHKLLLRRQHQRVCLRLIAWQIRTSLSLLPPFLLATSAFSTIIGFVLYCCLFLLLFCLSKMTVGIFAA